MARCIGTIGSSSERLNAEIACRQEFTGGEPVPFAACISARIHRDFYGQDDFEERYMAEFVGRLQSAAGRAHPVRYRYPAQPGRRWVSTK